MVDWLPVAEAASAPPNSDNEDCTRLLKTLGRSAACGGAAHSGFFMSKLTRPERLVFLDVLRLVAAVQMIQGHSVASVLAAEYRQGAAYSVWTFARGLTSVLFLTTAGLAFVLAEARGHSVVARRRRALRALRLIVIGYAMHAPLALLFGADPSATLRAALAVDVLQCIGCSLLGLELLSMLVQRSSARAAIGLSLGLTCFVAAPAARALTFGPATLALGNYLTTRYGSLFPLLPWAGYVWIGFALGSVAFRARSRAWALLAAAGAISLLLGLLGGRLGPALPNAVSPAYALVKLGCVLLLAGALARLTRGARALPPTLGQLASETLFLYVSHVVILYADGVGLAWLLGERHGPLLGLGLAAALLGLCSVGALAFRRALRSLRGADRGSTRGAQLP